MNAVPFDTLKLARDLETAGLTPPVAGGTAAALADALTGADLATRSDLARLEARMTAGFDAADARMTAGFDAVEARFDLIGAKFDAVGARFDTIGTRFDTLGASFDAKLELLRRDMTIKLGGMIFIAVGVLLTAMRLMPHP
jgi:hypothetical protein